MLFFGAPPLYALVQNVQIQVHARAHARGSYAGGAVNASTEDEAQNVG